MNKLELLSVREVAALKGCSRQSIHKQLSKGKIDYIINSNCHGKQEFRIPVSALEPALQRKYYQQHGKSIPDSLRQRKELQRAGPSKPLDTFSADQRIEIERWITILTDWRAFRTQSKSKTEADQTFLMEAPSRYGPDILISKDILYRKWNAYQAGNLEGLVDKRGRKKGSSDVPQAIKDLFLYTYLDETALPVSKCMEAVKLILQREQPELLDHYTYM